LKYSGDILVVLDTEGHLVSFNAMPQMVVSSLENIPTFEWNIFFKQAGLDISKWEKTTTQPPPLVYADTLVAWNPRPEGPGISNRIDAASVQGRPVRFEIQDKWNYVDQTRPLQVDAVQQIATYVFYTVMLIGGVLFARQNLRLGRGDRRCAVRIAVFIGFMMMLRVVLQVQHTLNSQEIFEYISVSLFVSFLAWIVYIALEPYVRRRWPQILVSWTRLWSGNRLDPLVARDLLIGCAIGAVIGSIFCILSHLVLPIFFNQDIAIEMNLAPSNTIAGGFGLLSIYAFVLMLVPFLYIGLLGILCFLRAVLKNQKVAAIVFVLLGTTMWAGADLSLTPSVLIIFVLMYFILMRFGLLTAIIVTISSLSLSELPITFDTTAWYQSYGYVVLAIFAVIVLYVFRTSLGGRPMFGTPRLDE
jgi:hypothetical protein